MVTRTSAASTPAHPTTTSDHSPSSDRRPEQDVFTVQRVIRRRRVRRIARRPRRWRPGPRRCPAPDTTSPPPSSPADAHRHRPSLAAPRRSRGPFGAGVGTSTRPTVFALVGADSNAVAGCPIPFPDAAPARDKPFVNGVVPGPVPVRPPATAAAAEDDAAAVAGVDVTDSTTTVVATPTTMEATTAGTRPIATAQRRTGSDVRAPVAGSRHGGRRGVRSLLQCVITERRDSMATPAGDAQRSALLGEKPITWQAKVASLLTSLTTHHPGSGNCLPTQSDIGKLHTHADLTQNLEVKLLMMKLEPRAQNELKTQ